MGILSARHLMRALPNSIAVVRDAHGPLSEQLRAEGIGVVVNPDAEKGMGNSLACGMRALPPATGFVIALADMPWIAVETINGVVRMLHSGAPIAAPVYQGQRGHPVGFCHHFREELISLDGDHGARELLARHAKALQLFEVDDPGVLRDIDTSADLAPDANLPAPL